MEYLIYAIAYALGILTGYFVNNKLRQRHLFKKTRSSKGKPNKRGCIKTNQLGVRTSYKSMKEAALENAVCVSAISQCCNGRAKTAGGCTWKYL